MGQGATEAHRMTDGRERTDVGKLPHWWDGATAT